MSVTPQVKPALGAINQLFVSAATPPIISIRNPLGADRAQIGTIWINKPLNTSYIITSVVANVATWQEISNAGGGGAIAGASLAITPGPTALTGQFTVTSGAALPVSIGADATDHDVTIGSQTGVSTLTLQSGTGDINLSPANTGDVRLGTATQTAASVIAIGQSTLGQPITIGNAINTVAQTISIATAASGANSVVNILTGVASAGQQIFQVLTGAASTAGVLNIGTGTAAHVTTIGSVTGAASTVVRSGTLALQLTTAAPVAGAGGILVTQGATAFRVLRGAGIPDNALAIQAGDLYVRSDPAGATSRMYIATGPNVWTNISMAA